MEGPAEKREISESGMLNCPFISLLEQCAVRKGPYQLIHVQFCKFQLEWL
jgi:hypothetical protein